VAAHSSLAPSQTAAHLLSQRHSLVVLLRETHTHAHAVAAVSARQWLLVAGLDSEHTLASTTDLRGAHLTEGGGVEGLALDETAHGIRGGVRPRGGGQTVPSY
jgi:hypothetical protein